MMAHPLAVPPAFTTYVTAPATEPPEYASVSAVRYVPDVEVIVRAAWLALPIVTVVWAEEMALKLESAALVAVTKQVLADVKLRVVPAIEQPVAVPPAFTTYVTAPVPEPPEEVRVTDVG